MLKHKDRMTWRLSALTFLVFLIFLAPAGLADLVVLKDGRRIEGKILVENSKEVKVKTSFGELTFPRADVVSIERGKIYKDEFDERWKAAKTADEFHDLGLWSESKKKNRDAKRCMNRAIELDPDHEAAHQWLGHVLHQGEWMTPKERAARIAEARTANDEAAQRAKGLVLHEGSWVTPEEKAHLEAGREFVDGKWLDRDAAQRARGYELWEGAWKSSAEVAARKEAKDLAGVAGIEPQSAASEHAICFGEASLAKLMADVAQRVGGARERFDSLFEAPAGLALFQGAIPRLWFLESSAGYERAVPAGRRLTPTLSEAWEPSAKRASGYWFSDPMPFSMARRANRVEEDLAGHGFHHYGHLLLNSHRYDGRLLPPWYDEGFAAWIEWTVHARNKVFCASAEVITEGTNAGAIQFDFDPRRLRDGKWKEVVQSALAAKRVRSFDKLASLQFSSLSELDIAVSMAICDWLSQREGAHERFLQVLRKHAPLAPLRVVTDGAGRQAIYDEAFQAAVQLDWRAADRAWRAELSQGD